MITFREGLEAFLIVGIILAYLARTQQEGLKKYVYYGTGAAIVVSLVAAVAFNLLAIQFAGRNEELFEGVVMLLTAAVLTSMIIWMLKESAHIQGDIQRKVSQSATTGLAAGLCFGVQGRNIDFDARSDGMFPLITNCEDLSLVEILDKYKYQPWLEKRHEQLKTVYKVAPVLLKSVTRIEGLLFVFFLAMLIQALIEREVRMGMKKNGLGSISIYP